MKFGEIAIDDAAGWVLAHSVHLDGPRIPKGRVLDARDIARLRAAGMRSVIAARLDGDDVPENAAAGRIAEALRHDSLDVAKPTTGRANVFARTAGLCIVEVEHINRMNAIHESMTIATLRSYQMVDAGQRVATVKIIPFAVPEQQLAAVVGIGDEQPPPLRVQPFADRTVGVIFSELPSVPFKGRDKAERVLTARLEKLGGAIDAITVCRHEAADVARAMASQLAERCDLVLVFGSTAIVDRGDVIPEAIVRAGGEVTYFGMPVEPGNMLLIGKIGAVDVVGLPGCARSPKFNGFDWVLQRLFAGLPVSGEQIATMGVGGLLN